MSDELTRFNQMKAIGLFRRGVLLLVAFTYVFVGILHHAGCEHTFTVSESTVLSEDGIYGGKLDTVALAACDHCPTCATGLAPDDAKISHLLEPGQFVGTSTSLRRAITPAPESPPPKVAA